MDLIYRYNPQEPFKPTAPDSAAVAMDELRRGNQRFAEIVKRMQECALTGESGAPLVIPVGPISLGLPIVPGGAPLQSPYALVVGCSDARAPVEAIFDQSFNSLFIVRVAGNVLGTECLGSIEYAVRNLRENLRLIVVLGHTECGAVTAAVDSYVSPEASFDIAHTYTLRSLVDRIQLAVRGASKALRETVGDGVWLRPGYRTALRDMAVYMNAAVTAFDLQREIRNHNDSPLEVVDSVYDLATVRVRANLDEPSTTFAPAPRSADDFITLGQSLAASAEIARVLG